MSDTESRAQALRTVDAFMEYFSGQLAIVLNFIKNPSFWRVLTFVTDSYPSTDNSPACGQYVATNVKWSTEYVRADLVLTGTPCNTFGNDVEELAFLAEYQTGSRLHVQIFDPAQDIYQVPESVLERPTGSTCYQDSHLNISITEQPFAFSVRRKTNGDIIFDTAGAPLVFTDQYWSLQTSLPAEPKLYGLGEHTDSLQLGTKSYQRTFWNRDAGGVPEGENLYGDHPVYFENRVKDGFSFSHGVALINSNGMDIRIDRSDRSDSHHLQYDAIGGIVDLFFLSGPGSFDVAQQYSEISGKAAMMPYWGLGFHNCRFGYHSVEDLEAVVANYSEAGIPLETMWTDIDYMDGYKVFTLSEKFPIKKMRSLIDQLHAKNQHYVVMVDPAVAYQDYGAFNRGRDAGIFLKSETGGIYQGIVWPGLTAYPDWFHPQTPAYWAEEFARFFNPETGVNIDALWIDMNEPANFCELPCIDPAKQVEETSSNLVSDVVSQVERDVQPKLQFRLGLSQSPKSRPESMRGLPGRDLINPKWQINNTFGALSNHTLNTSIIHANGLAMYDTHNLYGTMMSSVSRQAMLERRPTLRPMVITRSTFMGAGSRVGHWLGDNLSTWHHYRQSIRHMLQFTAFFQIPMVGADICGFIGNTTEELCARWTRLGAFYTFMRNHNEQSSLAQEFFQWPNVAEAARKGLDLRYRLLDYIYSAMERQSFDGKPAVFPLWMLYPTDPKAAAIELQFFYGPSLLINPMPYEGSTTVTFYLPKDQFYDLTTSQPIYGEGKEVSVSGIDVTDINVLVRAGSIIPMRSSGANTTTELRKKDFELLVAPDRTGRALGYLYLDDGESLIQEDVSHIYFTFNSGLITMEGSFGYPTKNAIVRLKVLGQDPRMFADGVRIVNLTWPLSGEAGTYLR